MLLAKTILRLTNMQTWLITIAVVLALWAVVFILKKNGDRS